MLVGGAVFPFRKPDTEDNDVTGEENAKKNYDKNYCAPRHEVELQPTLAANVKINYSFREKKLRGTLGFGLPTPSESDAIPKPRRFTP